MLKKSLIIIGIVIVLLLAAFWIYLLLFGTPQNAEDFFSNLGFAPATSDRPELKESETSIEETQLSIAGEGLSQLTTRPIAGSVLIETGDAKYLRYAEKGTGHVYEIDLQNGVENRLSGKTVAGASWAKFSPEGSAVALTADKAGELQTQVYVIPKSADSEALSRNLPPDSRNLSIISSSSVFYTLVDQGETTAYQYDIGSGSVTELWRLPLSDINVFLTDTGTYYIVNKPAPSLRGAIYSVLNGRLEPLSEQLPAYTGKPNQAGTHYLETYYDNESGQMVSYVTDVLTGDKLPLRIVALPEKCAFVTEATDLWCGAMVPNTDNTKPQLLRDWHSGLLTSNDMLWKNNLQEGYALLAVNFLESLGFIIDIVEPSISQDGTVMIFKNKLNDTLWLYRFPADLVTNS